MQLAKQKSNLIAVIASNIDEYFSSEYFKGIVSILSAQGYIGVLFDSNSDKIIESALLESVYNQNFAGLILQPLSTDRRLIEKFSNNHIPVVLIDRDIGNGEISAVTTNNFQVTKFAMTSFLDKGFKKLRSSQSLLMTYQHVLKELQALAQFLTMSNLSKLIRIILIWLNYLIK